MDEFVTPLYAFRARKKGYEVSVMKEMMMLVGLAAGPVRPPLANVKKEEIAEFEVESESVEAVGLILALLLQDGDYYPPPDKDAAGACEDAPS